MKKMCSACGGSGFMMGGGMLRKNCDAGCEKGHIYIDDAPIEVSQKREVKIDKRSKSYQSAIKEIMEMGYTKAEAEERFEQVSNVA